MNRNSTRAAIVALAAALIVAAGQAQGQSALTRYAQPQATTARFDAQRTGWSRVDGYISPGNLGQLKLQWRSRFNDVSAAGSALNVGLVSGYSIGATPAIVSAANNRVVVLETDYGNPYGDHAYGASPFPLTTACPGASLAAPARATPLVLGDQALTITHPGQSATSPNAPLPYSSAIGEVGQGIPPIKVGAMVAGPGSYTAPAGAQAYDGTAASYAAGAALSASQPAGAGRGGRAGAPAGAIEGGVAAPPPGGFAGAAPAGRAGAPGAAAAPAGGAGRGAVTPTYAVSNDGQLHSLTNQVGYDAAAPVAFIPAGAQASDLILVNGRVYTATLGGCNKTANGVWSIPATGGGATASWLTGGTASPTGVAFAPDGTLFTAVSSGTGANANALVALDPVTLAVKASGKLVGADFTTTPVVFSLGGRTVVAAQAADGRLALFDAADLTAPLATSPAASGMGGYKPLGLAYWQDAANQDWLVAATASSVIGYKVAASGVLTQAWTASVKSPSAPLVVNGVVFVASTGAAPGVLYALNASTGAKGWDSGKSIAAAVPRTAGLWNALGIVMVSDASGEVYAFGMPGDRDHD